jgi:hypothetical protein
MRPETKIGLAVLLAAVLLARGASAQQPAPSSTTPATTPSTTTPSDSTATAPAAVPADTAAQPTPQTGTPAASTQPGAASTQPSANSSDRPAFGVPNEPSAKSDTGAAKPDTASKPPAAKSAEAAKTDVLPSPGEALDPNIKKGSEDDVDAIGTRNIGARGITNWLSTNWEISTGKQYSMEIEKSAHLITDPVVVEYVNRVGQNIVKNSDCKVPFTIKIIDSDEINAMALPGGFFYVNSGLILAADEEAELAGVMAHETAHVCAHHAARGQTKGYYAEIASIPIMILAQGSYAGLGVYEASQLVIPMGLLEFSREYEAEADWLGVQYMYRAGYDPQAFIQIFEKLDALEKHKPGTLAKVFADHPQTPDRIAHSEEEIATILPARPDYMVTTSEFDDIKGRLARIENRRKLNDKGNGNAPTLRRTGGTNNDPNSTSGTSTTDGSDRPTLGRRD